MTTMESGTICVTIDAPFERVASDLADPTSHSEWATEFFASPVEMAADGEFATTVPQLGGAARYRVEADEQQGAFELYLAPAGAEFGPSIPVRLVRNGDGVDVLWTLHRFPGTPDEAWQGGLVSMGKELESLRIRHEERPGS